MNDMVGIKMSDVIKGKGKKSKRGKSRISTKF